MSNCSCEAIESFKVAKMERMRWVVLGRRSRPVLNREKETLKEKSSNNQSVSDVCCLCKCSFKTIYENYPLKSIPGELTQNTSYISTENTYNVSCRREGERPFLSSVLEKLGFSVQQWLAFLPCVQKMCNKSSKRGAVDLLHSTGT